MQSPELSLAGKLDTGLTKGLCLLLGWLIHIAIWLVGLLGLAGQAIQIFEYEEGLADVSWLEWSFMLLFALLLRRHVHYCRNFGAGFWSGVNRLLTFQGRLVCLGLGIFGFAVGFEQELGTSVDLLNTVADPVTELAAFGFVLLALYLAAPTALTESARPITAARVEPVFTSVEKEITE
ncbi:hypothetical protein N1078_18750 [Pseudomonas sp. MIL19]|uniref:hypothetical protein n=1 Tax=Pseudomonas sp. MIL19 TaxID=2976979 RepID=UPI0023631D35|nr:hypothetical protein [Pseudomonas sp. MIL19]MDD2162603.1 hypothetical protein [Pseudomonas sp. MIL19]